MQLPWATVKSAKIFEGIRIPPTAGSNRITKKFKKSSGKKGVTEFEGIAAGASQPVCLFQQSRNPLLLGEAWYGNDTFFENRCV